MHYIDFTACDRADRKEIEPMDETILAVGAHGKFAGVVIPELARRGATVRGRVRSPAHAPAVRAENTARLLRGAGGSQPRKRIMKADPAVALNTRRSEGRCPSRRRPWAERRACVPGPRGATSRAA